MAAAIVLAVITAAGAGITGATTAPSPTTVRTDAIAWLAPQVTDEGALISDYTGTPDPSLTAQALLGLAASGADSATVAKMLGYLEANVDDFVAPDGAADSAGALSWLLLDAVVTDTDAGDFGGVDLVSRLEATQQSDGLFGNGDPSYDGTFRQALALTALHAVGVANPAGVDWLASQQCADGGFVAYRADVSMRCPAVDPANFVGADTNSTAFAAIALHLAGETTAADAALVWLESVRTSGGGFAYLGDPSLEQDANSTGLVALAFRTLRGVDDAGSVAALASLQVPRSGDPLDRGGIAFQSGDALYPDLMATTQAILGLTGQAMPFEPVPSVLPPTPSTTTSPSSSTTVPKGAGGAAAPVATPVSAAPAYTG
ncbi:MAG TPA: prenyltransferase/squalene oxidase repeat-containing protein [Acidimicrobiales bacterium]|nr:prenyltransferase/squalene oxidase repeat-containing protein [Acidimicrobiales bacterium]